MHWDILHKKQIFHAENCHGRLYKIRITKVHFKLAFFRILGPVLGKNCCLRTVRIIKSTKCHKLGRRESKIEYFTEFHEHFFLKMFEIKQKIVLDTTLDIHRIKTINFSTFHLKFSNRNLTFSQIPLQNKSTFPDYKGTHFSDFSSFERE